MKSHSPSARAYRWVGYLALAHAGALVGLTGLMLQSSGPFRLRELWVGLVTLWFFWPIILVLHAGRSALRLGVIALLSAVLLWPSLRFYDFLAPNAFGLPDGISMNPLSAWMYFSAYRAGSAEAQKDIAAGVLGIEEFGFGAGTGHHQRILRERYHIEVRAIAQCVVSERIFGHAAGYNEVAGREIDRRVGRTAIEAAREEGFRLDKAEHEREEQYFHDLARRLSRLPSDAKIAIESARAYLDQRPLSDASAERELADLLHEVERCLVDTVPEEAPPFKMSVRAHAMPNTQPIFEVSGHDFPPEALWQTIYQNFNTLSTPRWSGDSLSVTFDFAIRPPQ